MANCIAIESSLNMTKTETETEREREKCLFKDELYQMDLNKKNKEINGEDEKKINSRVKYG